MKKKETYINTADGRIRVEWWRKGDFRSKVSIIPIPDDRVLCDYCNAEINEFPTPVLWGTHAACKKCYIGVQRPKGGSNGNNK